jgi:hypothetical protein
VTLWIRIRIGNPDPRSGSRGKKVKKFQWKNALFIIFFILPLKSINSTNYLLLKKKLMNNTGVFDLI